jgi:peptidoglycan/xylan/chitin deacetylase (PgdA/CDA1 family)
MRKVYGVLVFLCRPQFFASLLAAAVCVFGVYASLQPLAEPSTVLSYHRHKVAGAATISSTPPPAAHQFVDCAAQPCIALTFDDGPNAAITPQVLDILARHHARATFFVIGNHVPGNEALLRRMYAEGHEIGNHSWSHPDFTTLNPEQMQEQIAATQAAVIGAGVPAPTLFRPPYGAVNVVVQGRAPMTIAMWNIDPEDWKVKDGKKITARVLGAAAPGRVVDMHDTHQPTADSLDELLTSLQQQYQLVTFSELFNLAPGQPGVFYGR